MANEKNLVSEYFLFPATIFAADRPTRVQTILGSCVAVCLYDRILQHGAINHYMLPCWKGMGSPSPKYGNIAINQVIDKMLALGSIKGNIVAKIFGGADQHSTGVDGYQIGSKNIAMAQTMLAEDNIPIIAQSTGGIVGRRIVFYTHNNDVLLKFLQNGSTHEKTN